MGRPSLRRAGIVAVAIVIAPTGCGSHSGSSTVPSPLPTVVTVPTTMELADPSTAQSDPSVLTADESLRPDETYLFVVGTHCGVGRLGMPVNGIFWTTDTAQGERKWMPSEWADSLGRGEELITLEVVLSDDTTLTATAAGRSVVYRPTTADDPVMDCA